MRIKRISETLEKEYNRRKALSLLGAVIPGTIAVVIIILAIVGILEDRAFMLIYLAIALLLFGLNCLAYWGRLTDKRSAIHSSTLTDYIGISEKGILIEYKTDEHTEEKLLSWDELTQIDGFYINLGFSASKPIKYKMATIFSENSTEIPNEIINQTNIFKLRKAVKKYEPNIPDDADRTPTGVVVELYDDMLTEIRKYRKNDNQQD